MKYNEVPLELGAINHKGATNYPDQVDKYIEKEIELGATIGPFECIPFKNTPVAISPISTREKRVSSDRRIILDCSWPIRASLNDGIDKDSYLGQEVNLKYPTIDKLARKLYMMKSAEHAESIYMYKEDIDRAFRQLKADLRSVPLLGYRWRGPIIMICHL